MKPIGILKLIILLTALSINNIKSQEVLNQNFDGTVQPPTDPITLPTGWTIEGSEPWRFRNGGHNPGDVNWTTPPAQYDENRNPSEAHSWNYNAIFFKQSTNNEKTKLISPVLDLGGATKVELTFWLAQIPWVVSGTPRWDIMRVYYKTSSGGAWVLVNEYLDPVYEWEEFTIVLPPASYTSTTYIAFEGQTRWGFGTCIDDVKVTITGITPRYISEIEYSQPFTTYAATGSNNVPMMRTDIKVVGNDGSVIINSMSFKSLNTSDADIAIDGVKLYFSSSQIFNSAPENFLGTTNFESGVATFSDINLSLPTGRTYLWLAFDIDENATPGNTLDAMVEANSMTVNTTLTYPSTNQSPTGNRIIYQTIYKQDFEGAHSWDLFGFTVGTPSGQGGTAGGNPDPTSAFSGVNVVFYPGNYPNGLTEETSHKATSPNLDLYYYKNIRLSYQRYLNIEGADKAYIKLSNDNGTTWSNLQQIIGLTYTDYQWNEDVFLLSQSYDRSSNLKIRYQLGPTDSQVNYSGWSIDDVTFTGEFISRDAGVSEWLAPLTGCGLTNAEQVTVRITNYGGAEIVGPVHVAYSFNGGTSWIIEQANENIPFEGYIDYTFTTTVDLSTAGLRPNILAKTLLTGEQWTQNDQISTQIYVVPTYDTPYNLDFETNNGHWRTFGVNLWEHGTPSPTSTINIAASGQKVWVTKTSQTYGDITTLSDQILFSDNFEQDMGWTFTGEFERAIPNDNYYPYFSKSPFRCIGTDLTGKGANLYLYENNIGSGNAYTATSPAINVLNHTNLRLQFYRYLYIQEDDIVDIQVSPNNGSEWFTIWTNNGEFIHDDDIWLPMEYNIPDDYSNVSQFKVRFSLSQTSSSGEVAPGFNIDDVKIIGDIVNTNPAYLESPCFDLTGLTHPVLETKIWVETEEDVDGATFEYSIDGGDTWVLLSNVTSYDSYWNWFNGNPVSALGTDGWSGSTNGWITVKHLLPAALINVPDAKFRIKFQNDKYNNDFDGIAIDDFKIYEAPHDAGVTAIVSPTSACDLSANQTFTVTVKNFGIRNMSIGDELIIGYRIERGGSIQTASEQITLAAPINVGASTNVVLQSEFDMSYGGLYYIDIFSIENDPRFFSPSPFTNDTVSTSILVQKPYVNLGPDIYTTKPDTIQFDVTNYNGEIPDPNVTYKWQDNSTSPIFNVSTAGTYSVILTNTGNGCTASDEITVHKLIRDVGIESIISPITSCMLFQETPITIGIKNFGTDTLLVGHKLTLSYKYKTNERVDINYFLDDIFYPNTTIQFTFDEKFDMTAVGDYSIQVWATVLEDEDPSNETLSSTVTIYGKPNFDFSPDTIVYIRALQHTLDAGDWSQYYWRNNESTGRYYTAHDSGWVWATVTDAQGCFTTDSIYVFLLIRDVTPLEVITPTDACVYPNPVSPEIVVKNLGTDTLKVNDVINLYFKLGEGSWVQEPVTLTAEVIPEETFNHAFSGTVNLSTPSAYTLSVRATSQTQTELITGNDIITHNFTVYGLPNLSLGDSIFTRNSSVDIGPAETFDEYLWSTDETTQTITVTQTGWYYLTVTNNEICSVKDSVHVTFLYHNYTISQVVSPISKCYSTELQQLSVNYQNVGNDTLPSGREVVVGYKLVDNTKFEQSFVTTSKLVPGDFFAFTMTNPVSLTAAATHQLAIWGRTNLDLITNNDTINHSFTIFPNPVVNLGGNQVSNLGQLTLDAGAGYTSYLWQDETTNRTLTVTQTGTYSVTVTDSNGCTGSDEVYIIILDPDYAVTAITSPNNACSLSETETVTVTVANLGTDTLRNGDQIPLIIRLNGTVVANETHTFTTKFKPGESFTYNFSYKVNMSTAGNYTLNARTNHTLDLVPSNDSFEKTVQVFGSPVIIISNPGPICADKEAFTLNIATPTGGTYSGTGVTSGVFNPTVAGIGSHIITYSYTDNNGCSDTETTTLEVVELPTVDLGGNQTVSAPITLDAGAGFAAYLWQNGSTTQTFTVTQSGAYSVTVTDANGCQASDEVVITFVDPTYNVIVSELLSPVDICRTPTMPVIVTLTNKGQAPLTSGTSIGVIYQVVGRTPVSETLVLAQTLNPDETIEYTFNQKVNLTVGNTNIDFWTTLGTETSSVNRHTANVFPVPNVNLGPDTMLVTFPHYLAAQVTGTYLWSTGSTESYIYATQKGKYWLRVTNSDGCAGSDTIYLHDGTYIGTIPGSDIVVSIFPNPVKDNLHIIVAPAKPTEINIQIISPIGRNIHQSKFKAEGVYEELVDVSRFGSGIYLVKVSTPNGQLVLKVVVQR